MIIYLEEEICDPCGTIAKFKEDKSTGYKWCNTCKEWYFTMRARVEYPLQLELKL